MSEYPEHEKLEAVKERSQAIGEFIEFSDYTLCKWYETDELPISGGFWSPVTDINRVLAEYFEIDLNKLEEEKQAMLDTMRAMNEAR